MTVRLRPHHLLCLLTYVGRGYSPAFVDNYDLIAGRIAAGEGVLIVAGPDDVCAPLLADPQAHCRRDSVTERDGQAALDVSELLARPIAPGETLFLDPGTLARLRSAFAAGRTRRACTGCEWTELCSGIAAGGFAGVRVPAG